MDSADAVLKESIETIVKTGMKHAENDSLVKVTFVYKSGERITQPIKQSEDIKELPPHIKSAILAKNKQYLVEEYNNFLEDANRLFEKAVRLGAEEHVYELGVECAINMAKGRAKQSE